jgi:hypothetical protein
VKLHHGNTRRIDMEIDPNNLSKLVQRQMFVDPSNGIINKRIMFGISQLFMNGSDFTEKESVEMFNLLLVTSLKLTAVWKHKEAYAKREDELIGAARAKPIDETQNVPVRFSTAQDLYLELDGLLVQFKSCLDHMIHVLHYSFHLNFASLTTFGDKGDKIIALLRNNVRGDKFKKVAAQIAKIIEGDKEWLGRVIDLRDKMNHYVDGGIGLDNFTVFVRKIEGVDTLYTPRFTADQTIRDLMVQLFTNLIDFVEHFLGLALLPRLPKIAIQFKFENDPTVPRWTFVPIAAVRHLEKVAKPM